MVPLSRLLPLALPLSGFTSSVAQDRGLIEGITFAGKSGTIYAPLREISQALDLQLAAANGKWYLSDKPLVDEAPRLPDGKRLVPIRALMNWGFDLTWDGDAGVATLSRGDHQVQVRRGEKRVVIDKAAQEIRAAQGNRIVMRSPVSTGRRGHRTPNGDFTAGPYKARMHRSSLYDDAPMPWSVQITGNIFVHGYSSVPNVPASHGCIRLPVDGANPARFFYDWTDVGTPVEIRGKWRG